MFLNFLNFLNFWGIGRVTNPAGLDRRVHGDSKLHC